MTHKGNRYAEKYKSELIIKKLLSMPVLLSPEKEIIYRDKIKLSYTDLHERINRLANGLRHLGVTRGDNIAVFEYDSHRYLECFFAIPMMGAVLHPMNYQLSPARIAYTLNHAKVKVIMVNSELMPLVKSIKSQLRALKKIILISEDENNYKRKVLVDTEYEDMLNCASPSYNFSDFDENTKAIAFYTAGTTGLPKRIHFTHKQLVLHAFAAMTMIGSFDNFGRFHPVNDTYMPLTPMFHMQTWGIPYVATLLGTKQVYPGKYKQQMILKLIIDEGVTFSNCAQPIIKILITSAVLNRVDLSNWKVMIEGELSQDLVDAALELKIDIYNKDWSQSSIATTLVVQEKRDRDAKQVLALLGSVQQRKSTHKALLKET